MSGADITGVVDSTVGEESAILNVADYLPLRAREQGGALALAIAQGDDFVEMTSAELNERCDQTLTALHRGGIREGMRVVLMVTPSPDFFAITFALLKLGAIMVLVDPGMGVGNLGKCLEEADPDAFVGIPKAHVARIALRWMRARPPLLITVGRRMGWGGVSLDDLLSAPQGDATRDAAASKEVTASDDLAAILFTSGSTGTPKGAVYTHGVFAAQVRSLRATYGIEPGERDLSTFPLFALFGPALGMASVVPDMDASCPARADPAKLVAAAKRYRCTNMFANPALVDSIGRHTAATKTRLPGLERVICAGAPIAAPPLRRLRRALGKGVQIHTPYGATEALPVSSIGSAEILGETGARTAEGAGVCVGRPVQDMEVRIIAIDEGPIASIEGARQLDEGEIGEIIVRGPVVTSRYHGREVATRMSKIQDGETLWHRMGDVGYFDGHGEGAGRLWMCGRMSHRVVTAQGTMFTVCVEAIFNQHSKVRRSALVGVESDGDRVPVLCLELEPDAAPRGLVRELRAMAKAHGHTHNIHHMLVHPRFPVDVRHNAKIFREKLASWARGRI